MLAWRLLVRLRTTGRALVLAGVGGAFGACASCCLRLAHFILLLRIARGSFLGRLFDLA
jgi:hypothetical protein